MGLVKSLLCDLSSTVNQAKAESYQAQIIRVTLTGVFRDNPLASCVTFLVNHAMLNYTTQIRDNR